MAKENLTHQGYLSAEAELASRMARLLHEMKAEMLASQAEQNLVLSQFQENSFEQVAVLDLKSGVSQDFCKEKSIKSFSCFDTLRTLRQRILDLGAMYKQVGPDEFSDMHQILTEYRNSINPPMRVVGDFDNPKSDTLIDFMEKTKKDLFRTVPSSTLKRKKLFLLLQGFRRLGVIMFQNESLTPTTQIILSPDKAMQHIFEKLTPLKTSNAVDLGPGFLRKELLLDPAWLKSLVDILVFEKHTTPVEFYEPLAKSKASFYFFWELLQERDLSESIDACQPDWIFLSGLTHYRFLHPNMWQAVLVHAVRDYLPKLGQTVRQVKSQFKIWTDAALFNIAQPGNQYIVTFAVNERYGHIYTTLCFPPTATERFITEATESALSVTHVSSKLVLSPPKSFFLPPCAALGPPVEILSHYLIDGATWKVSDVAAHVTHKYIPTLAQYPVATNRLAKSEAGVVLTDFDMLTYKSPNETVLQDLEPHILIIGLSAGRQIHSPFFSEKMAKRFAQHLNFFWNQSPFPGISFLRSSRRKSRIVGQQLLF
eukprot:TRINITY_DN1763_c0_g1_i4.p1 TRINITY_DN1763_c0_g1~~TRINITY_DN1763_c0_g1_i4.p1  ORF type:complete len:540 (-),score=98.75 TRINITY_DN1763_c0_g1_i4:700-2319(-)